MSVEELVELVQLTKRFIAQEFPEKYTHRDSRIGNFEGPGAPDLRPAKQPISGGDMGDADGLKDGDAGAGKNLILESRCVYKKKNPPSPSSSKPQPSKKEENSFSLQPLPATEERSLEEMQKLIQKAAPNITLSTPATVVYLVFFEDISAHRFFLENVAKAITKHFAPASVVLLKNLAQLPPCRLVIAPSPENKEHELILAKGNTPLFTLAPLEQYLNDQNLKRALWTRLQSLPFQDLLQS